MSLTAIRIESEEKDEKQRKLLSALLTSFMLAAILAVLIIFGLPYFDPPLPTGNEVMVSMGQEFGGNTQETPEQNAKQEAAANQQNEESFETQDYEPAPEDKSSPNQTTPNTTPPNESKKQDKPKEQKVNVPLFESGDKNTNNGNDNTNGNKGKPDGTGKDPLGGYGLGGKGLDSYLSGRIPENTINASCKFGRSEVIIVKIKVNAQGVVTDADCVMKYRLSNGTLNATTNSEPYCSCAKQAAKGVKFTSKPGAPTQEGAIKFDYKVQ